MPRRWERRPGDVFIDYDADRMEEEVEKFTGPRQPHRPRPKPRVEAPGPGSYSVHRHAAIGSESKVVKSRNAPRFTFGSRPKKSGVVAFGVTSGPVNDMPTPGPGAYEARPAVGVQSVSAKPSQPAYSFSMDPRFGNREEVEYDSNGVVRGPRLGNTNPLDDYSDSELLIEMRGGVEYDVTVGTYRSIKQVAKTPGPGAYKVTDKPVLTRNRRAPAYTMPLHHTSGKRSPRPGPSPAEYTGARLSSLGRQITSKAASAPAARIGTALRPTDKGFSVGSEEEPGPGSYDRAAPPVSVLSGRHKSPGHLIGTARRFPDFDVGFTPSLRAAGPKTARF